MPEAIVFNYDNKIHTIYFNHAKAVLPVKLKNGERKLLPWGRREHDNSEMPLGGWARLANIKNNKNSQCKCIYPKRCKFP